MNYKLNKGENIKGQGQGKFASFRNIPGLVDPYFGDAS